MPDKPEDEIDWEEVLRLMREHADKGRGYAEFWEWAPDKAQAEAGVASTLADYLSAVEGIEWRLGKHLAPNDPPDVLFTTADGRRIGIEVTELVSPEAAAFHRHRKKTGEGDPYAYAHWTAETVADALRKTAEKKDGKLFGRHEFFDEIWLAIATDEPIITLDLAQEALRDCEPAVQAIDRAFLLLSYHPEADKGRFPDGCPVLSITLKAGNR